MWVKGGVKRPVAVHTEAWLQGYLGKPEMLYPTAVPGIDEEIYGGNSHRCTSR